MRLKFPKSQRTMGSWPIAVVLTLCAGAAFGQSTDTATTSKAATSLPSLSALDLGSSSKPSLRFAFMTQGPSSTNMSETASPEETKTDMEEIMVVGTGLQSSLRSSAEFKRGATGVVDLISSEDLGKFPDTNVAESLQRITGVGITRTRGGEGQFVTVRGLGEEFNAVTYNGRLLATENNGREFSFDVIASELIGGAEVYKTPTANQGDGSLGGRVNLRPAMPLDTPGLRAIASIGGQHEGLADTTGLRASGVASYNWDDTFGILGSFSYQKRNARTDVAESTFLVNDVQVDNAGFAGVQLDQDGDGRNDTTNAPIVTNDGRFNGFAVSLVEQERERLGGTLAMQYRPSNKFTLTVDGLYTAFRTPSVQYSYSYFPTLADPSLVAQDAVLNGADQIVSHSATPFATDLVVRENEGDTQTFAVGANARWEIVDGLEIDLDASFSRANGQRDNLGSAGGSGGFFVIGYPDGAFRQLGLNGRRVPDVFFTAANTPGGQQLPLSQLSANDARLHFARNDFVKVEDEIISGRGDINWWINDLWKLALGVDVVGRQKQNKAFNNVATQCAFCGYATPFADFGDPGRLFRGFTPSDFLAGADANIPRVFPRLNPDAIRAAYANGAPDALTAIRDRSASSIVEEIVMGGYFQVDHLGTVFELPYAVNLGLRLAYTDLTSKGFGNVVSDVVSVVRASDGNNQTFTLTPPERLVQTNSYLDILPSLNVSLDIFEGFVARVGVSRSLSRPTLTDLSTFFSVSSTNVGGEGIVRANPALDPIRSTNFDISLELYSLSGSYVAIAGFYKKIDNFVTQRIATETVTINDVTIQQANGQDVQGDPVDIVFRIQEPQNGDSADIYGLEIGGQYLSNVGLGIAANITLADSEATSGGIKAPLENISNLSANVSIFYERAALLGTGDGISARISMNHRSDYLVGQTFEGGRNEFVDDFTQFDLSLKYNITEGIGVFFDGINITDEKFFRFSETRDFLESFEVNGARWVFGVRGQL